MVAIPQITRDRLQGSSVVGTPGVDTSGQQAFQAVAAGATETADAGFSVAIERQNLRNEGEYASLMVDHSMNIMSAAEQIKKQYADNPDAMPGALSKSIQDSLTFEAQRASNPMVKLMVGRGDPSAQMWAMRQIQQDSYEQGWRNTVAHATNTLDTLTQQASKIGGNLDLSPNDMIERLDPLLHTTGQLFTSIDNSAHQQLADSVLKNGQFSIMKGLVDPAMEAQPVKAAALLNDPRVAKFFPPDELKKYQDQADMAIKAFPKKMMTQQIQQDLTTQPAFVQDVMAGKKGYADIDRMQRMDQSGMHDNTYNYLKDIALGTGPAAEKQAETVKAQFVDEAARLGMKLKEDPSDLAKADVMADKKAIMSANVKDLYKFQDDLLDARRRNVISTQEFNMYYDKLYTPLVSATMKNHDPAWYDNLVNNPKDPHYGQQEMPGKVDDFGGAYHVIENYLGLSGGSKRPSAEVQANGAFATKSAYYDEYFKQIGKKMGQLMPNSGNVWTPREVAYSVLGISKGQMYKFPTIGNATIDGHDADGTPIHNLTKTEEEALANAKALKASQGNP